MLTQNGFSCRAGRAARILLLFVCAAPAATLLAADVEADEAAIGKIEKKDEKRVGFTIHIRLPINGQTVDRTKQFVRRALEKAAEEHSRVTLVLKFVVPDDQNDGGRGSEFGASLDLAEFLSSDTLNGVRTVAWIPQTIKGHALLVAMACDEIIMAKAASIGQAGIDEPAITETRRLNYTAVANRRRIVPAAVAAWMLDPSQEVFVVQTEVSREFASPAELEALRKNHTIKSQRKLFDRDNPQQSLASQPGLLTGEEARSLGITSLLADSPKEAAKGLELQLTALDENPGLVSKWKAVRVDLKGPITEKNVDEIIQIVDRKVRQDGVDFICLWIDSPGGSLSASLQLARFIDDRFESSKVRTVAFIPREARSSAALVALACWEVVLGERALLGGPGAVEFSAEDISQAVKAVRDPKGPWRQRNWSLVAATIDPRLSVYRCTRDDETAYLSEREIEDLERRDPNAKPWQKHNEITQPGDALQLDGQQARQFGLIKETADNFDEFRRLYGLEHEPELLAPGWAEILIDWLKSPGVSTLLIMIGLVALYIELHTPGIGLGGFVATVCFVLFFWAHVLGGTAGWLEASLFIGGVLCLLVEFFILPGFGIFGVGGGAMVLASLVLASQTFVLPHNTYQFAQLQRSLLTIVGAIGGFGVVAYVLRGWLPKAPLFNQVFLQPPEGEEAETISRREAVARYDDLVGQRGTATTQLTPSGKARFGDRLVDVITEGDLVVRGADIEVVEVKGNRVLVREVSG